MKDKCIKAVSVAAGRDLNTKEITSISERITKNMEYLARTNNDQYLSWTREQRLMESAKLAAKQIVEDAQKEQLRVAMKIQKHDNIQNYLDSQKEKYGMSWLDSLRRIVAFVSDGKSDNMSIESHAKSTFALYKARLLDTFDVVGSRFLGLASNTDGERAMMYELYNQDLSDIASPELAAAIKKGSKAWRETSELLRQQFNNAGGDIKSRSNWGIPQKHSQKLVADAGRIAWLRDMSPAERAAAKLQPTPARFNDSAIHQAQWVKDTLPKLDRKQYVNDDGGYYNNKQMVEFLKEAWETIATGGANGEESGKYKANSKLSNQRAQSRSLHYKDADSHIEYHNDYGGTDLYTTMIEHVYGISRDIASLETLGPNPDLMIQFFVDKAKQEQSKENPRNTKKFETQAEKVIDLYKHVAGKTDGPVSEATAAVFDTARSWFVSTKLGSAFISSFSDNATMHLTAQVNGMSSMKLIRNQLAVMNPANREELRIGRRSGLSLQTFSNDVNRWGQDNLGASFSKKMADLTIRGSFLNAATEGRRRAFGRTMYDSIGATVTDAKTMADLHQSDKRLLESKGINETVFQTWKQAEIQDWGHGDTILSPEAIYRIPDEALQHLGNPSELRRDAALRLLAMVNEEIDMAIINPGAIDQMKMGSQFRRGTILGEIAKSVLLFKSMPIALMSRHFLRGMNQGNAYGKAVYIAALMAGTTICGAAAVQFNNFVSGKDPQDMTDPKFWAAAAMKGGSLGIYGDFLLNTETQHGRSPVAAMGGVGVGYVEDMLNMTHGNLIKHAKGEKTHAGSDFIRFMKGNIPGNNFWYMKAGLDRLVFNNLQEMVSPGYSKRVEQRAKKYKETYYWSPGETLPDRSPDFGKSIGN
jgi:hypothetical protein